MGRKPGAVATEEEAGLSRREILARAAEERIRKQRGMPDEDKRNSGQAS